MMKKFSVLERVISKEFGSVWIFSKESGIPRSSLSKLINGKYGSDEKHIRKRIEEKLRELRPEIDISNVWDLCYTWYEKHIQDKSIIKTGFKITVYCKLNDEGELKVSPSFQGF
jgi:predicted transcriptional regulator